MAVRRPAHAADLVPPTPAIFSGERAPHKGSIGYEGSPGDGYAGGVELNPDVPADAPDRVLTSQLSRAAAAARSAARRTSSGWTPGTAAMAPVDFRFSGAPA
jgi:hypothetical protein